MRARLLCVGPALLLAACSGNDVKQTLGLDRKAPDEFRVVSRPPLSVPPDFNLRPPAEGNEVTGSTTPASAQASEVVLGRNPSESALRPGSADTAVMGVSVRDAASGADAQFLAKAGAQGAQSDIREQLRRETGDDRIGEEKSTLEKLREPANKETLVDAKKEKERLEANEQQGKPATQGDTPVIKPKDSGWLGRLF